MLDDPHDRIIDHCRPNKSCFQPFHPHQTNRKTKPYTMVPLSFIGVDGKGSSRKLNIQHVFQLEFTIAIFEGRERWRTRSGISVYFGSRIVRDGVQVDGTVSVQGQGSWDSWMPEWPLQLVSGSVSANGGCLTRNTPFSTETPASLSTELLLTTHSCFLWYGLTPFYWGTEISVDGGAIEARGNTWVYWKNSNQHPAFLCVMELFILSESSIKYLIDTSQSRWEFPCICHRSWLISFAHAFSLSVGAGGLF